MKKNLILLVLFFLSAGTFAQEVDFTIRFNETTSEYEVYSKPTFNKKNYFIGGGSQISLVLPSEIENRPLLIETIEGGPWLDNSQVYSPVICKTCDFHGIASNGSKLDFVIGEEKLLFTFVIPNSESIKSVRLFDNINDPQSNAIGMGGGDFNNFFASALTLKDIYRANYNNQKEINGIIKDWKGQRTHLVNMTIESSTKTTTEDGRYNFNLLANNSFSLNPKKEDNPLNGITTLDIINIQKHLLQIKSFKQPEQWVAADVNKSGTISVSDILEIRKLILGTSKTFPNNSSWCFINTIHQFNKENPLKDSFQESVLIEKLDQDLTIDFTAIKVGDVNGTAIPNTLIKTKSRTSPKVLTISVNDAQLIGGNNYTIDFSTKQFNIIQGYQFSLQFESVMLRQVNSIIGGKENFGITKMKDGLISTSWNKEIRDNMQLANGSGQDQSATRLFTIEFQASHSGKLSEQLSISNHPTAIEAYDLEGNILDVQLNFMPLQAKKSFELYQNEPNPYKNTTYINFYLPGDSEVDLTLRDEAGRVFKTIKENRKAGFNSFKFTQKDFAKGLIIYQMDTKFGSKNRKMLRLK